MTDMKEIEELAAAHADALAGLEKAVATIDAAQRAAVRRYLSVLWIATARVGETEKALSQAIEANRTLFEKPRTRLLHGLRVGLRKQKGEILFDDPERVVALIRRRLPDLFGSLVKVTETPVRDALARLPARDLQKLGVEVANDTDAAFVKCPRTDARKHALALLETFGPKKGKGK